jgi:hypothetical protein
MKRMMNLYIAGRLPGLNELLAGKSTQCGNWNRYNELKCQWYGQIKLLTQARKIGLQEPGYATVLFREPNTRRDPDNVVGGGTKLLFDSLVGAGVLPGDGWQTVLGYVGYWVLSPKQAGCLIHWGDELLTKTAMLALMEKELKYGGRENEASRGAASGRP